MGRKREMESRDLDCHVERVEQPRVQRVPRKRGMESRDLDRYWLCTLGPFVVQTGLMGVS